MMRYSDILGLAARALSAHRLRTALILVSMAVGVASVITLTALGDGARHYITGQFAALGTNLIIVLPGRAETTGGPPPLMGQTPRDLTLDDALDLARSPHIRRVAPVVLGSAPVSFGGLEREVNVFGSTAQLADVRQLEIAKGRFLPTSDPHRAASVCVIGTKLKREMFGQQRALGQWLRVGDRRYRVIGILSAEGQSIGVDFDDNVILPVASAAALFDSPALFRILIEAKFSGGITQAKQAIRERIMRRHEGEDDITIITQDSVIATFDKILSALTYGLAGIAAVSLLVAGILTMNVMLVSVAQRTGEIGLLKALGAPVREIRLLFVTEAILLSIQGALGGLVLGLGTVWILARVYPTLPFAAPPWAVAAGVTTALITGLTAGVIPAARAARLDPVDALAHR